jgi:SAM-dependent methyltransferase
MGEARYDAIIDFYEEHFSGDFADPTTSALFDLAGSLLDSQVLDLGCGHGHLAREMARRGARVVGVDISGSLLEQARLAEEREPLGIRYVQTDVASQAALAGETFDLVVANFTLTDIDDLVGTVATIARLLEPGGGPGHVDPASLLCRWRRSIGVVVTDSHLPRRGLVALPARARQVDLAAEGGRQPPDALDVSQCPVGRQPAIGSDDRTTSTTELGSEPLRGERWTGVSRGEVPPVIGMNAGVADKQPLGCGCYMRQPQRADT